jgi:crossover junction endodeoxyribonuclease RusA
VTATHHTPAPAVSGEAAGAGTRTWTLMLPPGLPLLSLNHRLHWAETARRKKGIRTAAWAVTKQQKVPFLGRIRVTGEYQPPDRRKRDEDNLAVSLKAAIDGIRDAGVVLDDTADLVTFAGVRIGERYPRGRLLIHITELPG